MSSTQKTHFRKAFDSPYLGSADVVDHIELTVRYVRLEADKTKKTKDKFNTAYFVQKEIRPGEPLKPMILNATNSKTMRALAGSPFIDDWQNINVLIYVDSNVRFGKETTEGLRISPNAPEKKYLTPALTKLWENAKVAYKRDGNLDAILERMEMTEEHQQQLIAECEETNAVS
jgi:hypothetical protein